jgi:hypothetical protein
MSTKHAKEGSIRISNGQLNIRSTKCAKIFNIQANLLENGITAVMRYISYLVKYFNDIELKLRYPRMMHRYQPLDRDAEMQRKL